MYLEHNVASQIISEIEGCKNTRYALTNIADILCVEYEEVLAIKTAFEDGYTYEAIKLVYDKYHAYEKLNNDAPVLAEFFRMFPSLFKMLTPELTKSSKGLAINSSNNESFKRITVSVLSNIYNLTDNHRSIASLSTFLNLNYDYIKQIRAFNSKSGLNFELANYIMQKWFAQRLRTKSTPSISEFFIELEPTVKKYLNAMELTKLGANKLHLLIFCGLTPNDAREVRKSCGITTAKYDSAEDHETDALYNYLEQTYEHRTEEQLTNNLNTILIELCHSLDAGLPELADKRVKGSYNATFSHLLKLLEYNAMYGAPVNARGKPTVSGILCKAIRELYLAQGLDFGNEDEEVRGVQT